MTENSKLMRSGHAHHENMIQFLGSESRYWSLFDTLHKHPEQTYTDQIEGPAPKDPRATPTVHLRRATSVCGADGRHKGILGDL